MDHETLPLRKLRHRTMRGPRSAIRGAFGGTNAPKLLRAHGGFKHPTFSSTFPTGGVPSRAALSSWLYWALDRDALSMPKTCCSGIPFVQLPGSSIPKHFRRMGVKANRSAFCEVLRERVAYGP